MVGPFVFGLVIGLFAGTMMGVMLMGVLYVARDAGTDRVSAWVVVRMLARADDDHEGPERMN